MTENKDSTKNEFVELYNDSGNVVSLNNYALRKKTSSGSESTLVSSSKFFGAIAPHGYFVISHPDFQKSIKADLSYSSASYSIADNNKVLLYDNSGKLIDEVGFGSAGIFPNPDQIKSLGKIGKNFVFNFPTPGKENTIYIEPVIEKRIYPNNIQITEILPHPEAEEDEFIELYNGSDERIDLQGWSLHDASASGEYTFNSQIIESQNYLVVYRKVYEFALNDSGEETLALRNPNKDDVFKLSYSGSKQGVSYNFNGVDWHWSKFLTPGQENIFEKIPDVQVNVDKNVYLNVYANFEIDGLKKDDKVTWDFGDGHKSYLQKTRHKYSDKGKYEASVKYSEGSEDLIKDFTVDVQRYPHYKIRIVKIVANPKGADTGKEFLLIENKTKRKIDLKNWSIATGTKKSMINHPIREELMIKRGKNKNLSHEQSSFTLNNKRATIELRYPDSKVAQRIKYEKADGIKDDEIYQKIKGAGWTWIVPAVSKKFIKSIKFIKNEDIVDNQETINNQNLITNIEQQSSENKEHKNIPTKKVEIEMLKNKNLTNIELLNDIPYNEEDIREYNGQYFFTATTSERRHYTILAIHKLVTYLNVKINFIINFF